MIERPCEFTFRGVIKVKNVDISIEYLFCDQYQEVLLFNFTLNNIL